MTPTLTSHDYRHAVELSGLKSTRTPNSSGGFYMCPHHTDKTPSLRVDFTRGIFNCFSCHWSGTVNTICRELTHKNIYQLLGYTDPFNLVSKNERPVYVPYVEEEVDESKVKLDIQGVLLPVEKSTEAIKYLKSRGISLEIAKKYEMKYAENVYINRTYFNNRIMTPIYGITGKLVNYEGRDVTRQARAKVLYPKNSVKPLFDYNSLDKTKPLYLVEGLIDLFLLKSDPYFVNVSAMLGSALSPYQAKNINEFEGVILIPNNDTAGAKSVDSVFSILAVEGSGRVPVSVLKITDPYIKDIGEIHEKLNMTVKQYREEKRFALKPYNSFIL